MYVLAQDNGQQISRLNFRQSNSFGKCNFFFFGLKVFNQYISANGARAITGFEKLWTKNWGDFQRTNPFNPRYRSYCNPVYDSVTF